MRQREITPIKIRFPSTFLASNCCDGLACTKSSSVTGKKAKVPNSPDSDTVPLAFCRTSVSAFTKQLKTVEYVVVEPQPAAFANARYFWVVTGSSYLYCIGRYGLAAMSLRPVNNYPYVRSFNGWDPTLSKRVAFCLPPYAIACSMTAPAPADSPATVTLLGSPPNFSMWVWTH